MVSKPISMKGGVVMSNNLKKVVYGGLVAASLLAPVLALAALPNPVPPVTGNPVTLQEIQDRIQQIAQFLIIVSVILAVIYIIWGGIAWMMAGGDETKGTAAKQRIWHGVFGAAIVLAVGVILQTLAALITRSFFG